MQTTVDRRDFIVQLIRNHGKVHVDRLREKLDVSGVTIRNDLEFLESKGILYRIRGGALLQQQLFRPSALNQERRFYPEEKRSIGKKAAELIKQGDSVLFNSGITTFQIAVHLSKDLNLSVMTNSVDIGVELINKKVNVLFTGGRFQKESYSFAGPDAEAAIKNYYFDKLFLETDGVDLRFGLTTSHPAEAQLIKIMIQRAREIICVTDSSKLNRRSFSHICYLETIDKLVTDTKIPADIEQELKSINIEIIKS